MTPARTKTYFKGPLANTGSAFPTLYIIVYQITDYHKAFVEFGDVVIDSEITLYERVYYGKLAFTPSIFHNEKIFFILIFAL